ncbi:polysaccharide biosynthesis/export family protein [Prevotella sp. PINT]|jgi:Periplasmic protein involved in polysaccharide export|uniref:polysaccharide biosynthesis/export family protein n=1 Tax=Palleniella intestinalis TaxID=2736291 RepID=UPI001556CD50|nr:polysaccharide biosynthesis/export family protein [Palleniella intestinalis]NPD81341.1 polysaccharide biosynthesis/export family protein [Palleniella intestinalis]
MNNIVKAFAIILVAVGMWSCSTPKDIAYFQDKRPGTSEAVAAYKSIPFKLRPGDRVSIYVKSRNEDLTKQFNINDNSMQGSQNGNKYGYLIDNNGKVDFPVLGKIQAAGMNRQELTDSLTKVLRTTKLVDDAIVKVEYTGLYVTVLGQGGGRRVNIERDNMTFFELLGEVGDLDIDALRKNILVIREEDGVRSQYELDMTMMKNVYDSPAYYVHQNDIVYIEPNDKTKRNSTVNGNLFQSWGFWTGAFSLVLTILSISGVL